MDNFKFKDITKKVDTKNINLLTGKSIKITKKKQAKKIYTTYKNDTDIEQPSLYVEISKYYKGKSDNIAGALNLLPQVIKTFIKNGKLTKVIATHNRSIFVLDNIFTFIIEDRLLGKHKGHNITIKQGKNIITRKFVKN